MYLQKTGCLGCIVTDRQDQRAEIMLISGSKAQKTEKSRFMDLNTYR